MMPYRQDKIKVILTFRPDNIEKFLSVIRQDFKDEEIYVYAHGEREIKPFEDKFAASAKIIIFVSDEKSKGLFLTYKFIEEHSMVLRQFLKQARVFLNLATPLHDKRNCPIGLLSKTCEIISVKELFTPKRIEYVNSDGSRNISAELGRVSTSEMGLITGQAGLFLDERLVRICQDKDIIVVPEDFDNIHLARAFLDVKGCNVVGYVQQLSALQLSVDVVVRTSRSKVVNLLSRQNELTPQVLSQSPFNEFSTIELYDHQGTLINSVKNFGNGHLLRVFNFSGISNHDKLLYLKSAEFTLGSGDSSFQECIATGKLFVWEVPTWKAAFIGRLAEFCVTNDLKSLANYFIYLNKSSIHCAGVARIEHINQFVGVINGGREQLNAECEKFREIILKKYSFAKKFRLMMSKPDAAQKLFLEVASPFGALEKECIDSCNNIMSNCDDLFYEAIHKNDTKALKAAFESFPFLNLDHVWKNPTAGMAGDECKLIVFCVRVNPKANKCFSFILNHYSDYGKEALVIEHFKDAKVKLPKHLMVIFEQWKKSVLIDAKDLQLDNASQSKKK